MSQKKIVLKTEGRKMEFEEDSSSISRGLSHLFVFLIVTFPAALSILYFFGVAVTGFLGISTFFLYLGEAFVNPGWPTFLKLLIHIVELGVGFLLHVEIEREVKKL